jgi:DNA invertase Pin-like site-specific DNA recombinase
MATEWKTKAVGYVCAASSEGTGSRSEIGRHGDIIIAHCRDSQIALTHMIIDIGGRQGRGRAFDLLVMERASLLIVPSLAQLARSCAELAPMLAHYFIPPAGVADLFAVVDGIDTRTAQGRIAIDVLRTVARFESGSVYHA